MNTRPNKQYKLDDGSVTDAYKVAKQVGITLRNARSRLSISRDPKRIFKRKQEHQSENHQSYKMRAIMEREASMYNDMFVLAFTKINTRVVP